MHIHFLLNTNKKNYILLAKKKSDSDIARKSKHFLSNKTDGELLYWFTYTTGLSFLLQACVNFLSGSTI
jgi:hypothetical protein